MELLEVEDAGWGELQEREQEESQSVTAGIT